MDSPIEIRVNQSVFEKLILKSFEQSVPDVGNNNLKMFTADEVSELIHCTRQHVITLRNIGILKSIRTGKNYMFSQKEIERFQQDYEGHDVSNRVKAIEAYNIVKEKAVAGNND